MGVQSIEVSSLVALSRLFKALYLDAHTLMLKLFPEAFKSVEFVQGDCVAAGSIKQYNFVEGYPLKYVKKNIYGEVDVENMYVKYTIIEGDVLEDKREFIIHEAKFVAFGSGTLFTFPNHYHPKGDVVLEEEKIQIGHGKMKELFKKLEDYV